jgi:hypothetical protein
MKNRWIVSGIAAGVVVFVWGAIAHMLLPLGEAGIKSFGDEAAVVAVFKDKVPEAGFYFFPGERDQAKWQQDVLTGPRGILIVTPPSVSFSMGRSMGMQVLINVLGGILLAGLFAVARANLRTPANCVLFGALAGAFACLAVEAPQWNWYGFPTVYLLAQFVTQIVGWGLAGLTLGLMMKRAAA